MYYPRSYHPSGFALQGAWRLISLGLLMSALIGFVGVRLLNVDTNPAATPTLHLNQLPLAFVPNQGQSDARVRFQVANVGGTAFFTQDGVVLAMPAAETDAGATLRLHFIGANSDTEIVGRSPLPGVVNYLRGSDSANWHTDLPTYGEVIYRQLYAGIDLQYTGTEGAGADANGAQARYLKGTYTVMPGADPTAIRWWHGGATNVQVDPATGNLLIRLADNGGTLTEQAPVAWQVIDGRRVTVPVQYTVATNGQVGFALGQYQSAHALIIDPTIVYSTYLGGSAREDVEGLAVDGAGNAYITGSTRSSNFPSASPVQDNLGGEDDVFVTKINAAGTALLYSTYLGGSSGDQGVAIAVDTAGNAYITGDTQSTDFPTANAYQPSCAVLLFVCAGDVFVAKLNSSGNALLYSTYLGGNVTEVAGDIAVDSSGHAYVVGSTASEDFPLASPLQVTNQGSMDAFLTKLNGSGNGLVYSTYFGGTGEESGLGIAVSGGEAHITGLTTSGDFPTANAYQPSYGGDGDAFVARFDAAGQSLRYSTFLGGGASDVGHAIALDSSGNAYLTGNTEGQLPTQNPVQPTVGGNSDAFVAKLNRDGNSLIYSTYLGGSASDDGRDIAVDGAGNAYITGETLSTDFPIANALQSNNRGNSDAFVAKLNNSGDRWLYSTYLGGDQSDHGDSIAVAADGNAYIGGVTFSTNFPLVNAIQGDNRGSGEGFVLKLGDGETPPPATATPTLTAVNDPTATATPTQTPDEQPTTPPLATTTATATPTPTETAVDDPTATPTQVPTTTASPVAVASFAGSIKYASRLIVGPNEELTYKIRLHNSGTSDGVVTVRDPVPDALTYVAGSATNGGTYEEGSRTITWRDIPVSIGGAVTLQFGVTTSGIISPLVVVNTAFIEPLGQAPLERQFPVLLSPIPLNIDVIPPFVDEVIIGDSDLLNDRNVTVHVAASDDLGVEEIYLREWILEANPVPHWRVVQNSDWMPFAEEYAWTLSDQDGTHFVGVWARDGAGNTSFLQSDALDFASLNRPNQAISADGLVPYLVYYPAGTTVSATLTPAGGDADLYVWYPGNSGLPDHASIAGGSTTENISFTTPRAGTYLLLVYGASATEYTLVVTPLGGPQAGPLPPQQVRAQHSTAATVTVPAGVTGEDKEILRSEPVLFQSGMDPLSNGERATRASAIYLPLVQR